jgi:hypothetical protein
MCSLTASRAREQQRHTTLLYDRRNTVHRMVDARTPGQAVRKALRANQLCWIDEIDHTYFTSFCGTCAVHGTPVCSEHTLGYTAPCCSSHHQQIEPATITRAHHLKLITKCRRKKPGLPSPGIDLEAETRVRAPPADLTPFLSPPQKRCALATTILAAAAGPLCRLAHQR